jgi:deoxyribodipyrimidine photo-lyase
MDNLRDFSVPEIRIRRLGREPTATDRRYVLYWMTAFRRLEDNFALQRALQHCAASGKPLLILESLEIDYPWACPRFHQAVLDGMRENRDRAAGFGAAYLALAERAAGQVVDLLEALSKDAVCVVSDDFPDRRHQSRLGAAAERVGRRFEAVDCNGLLPMRAASRVYPSAYAFRRFLQGELPSHLVRPPLERPLEAYAALDLPSPAPVLPEEWPPLSEFEARSGFLRGNRGVDPVAGFHGGTRAAEDRLESFLRGDLDLYGDFRNHPERDVGSRLSSYLHFGHISVHRVFRALARREGWSPHRLSPKTSGGRTGWWGMGPNAEAFLDELVTWRELGYNMAWQVADYDRWKSLPDWARDTLLAHSRDEREHRYTAEEFERAETHDPLWNAAQIQLREEGRIHNYLRMLWGKKILHWTAHPAEALDIMIELNNKYALDGSNPNSYTGICWVLGRYDRAWGPERPIFGKIRYMSSENTARKFPVGGYVRRFAADGGS